MYRPTGNLLYYDNALKPALILLPFVVNPEFVEGSNHNPSTGSGRTGAFIHKMTGFCKTILLFCILGSHKYKYRIVVFISSNIKAIYYGIIKYSNYRLF